jgi:hypothetical protein
MTEGQQWQHSRRYPREGEKTHDIKVSALVSRTLGPLKAALEVERRVVYQLDLNVGRLVVLAICADPRVTDSKSSQTVRFPSFRGAGRTGDFLVDAAQAGIHGSTVVRADAKGLDGRSGGCEEAPGADGIDFRSRVVTALNAFRPSVTAGCFESDASVTLPSVG